MYERMTVLLLLVLAVDGWKDPIGRICLIFHVKNTHAREEQRKYHQKEASQQNDHLLQWRDETNSIYIIPVYIIFILYITYMIYIMYTS